MEVFGQTAQALHRSKIFAKNGLPKAKRFDIAFYLEDIENNLGQVELVLDSVLRMAPHVEVLYAELLTYSHYNIDMSAMTEPMSLLQLRYLELNG
ncbi:hypothetical protein H4S03_009512, partial [Coemansia sp. S3946]